MPLLAMLMLSVPALAAEPPEVSAKAAVLMDAASGRVLWEKNGDEPRLIASTTKIMTAMVALERVDPELSVVVDPAWAGVEGSSMYLRPGQELTVRELLYGLMLASGNDAAAALACVTAGSVEAFAELMNQKAAALGCEHTHFENPSGLDSAGHFASAHDLALIARAAIQNETLREIASTKSKTVGELTYTNHNRLLGACEGVFGLKTGYTTAAGRTLVSCCERNGVTLICVTLCDPDDWRDHAALYDWAYGEYVLDDVAAAAGPLLVPVIGGIEAEVEVFPESPLRVLHRPGEPVKISLELPAFVYAAVACGGTAGRVSASVGGTELGAVRLVYNRDVARMVPEGGGLLSWLHTLLGFGERKIYTLT